MSIATYDSALAPLGAVSQWGACRGVFVPVNTAQPGTILKSGHSNLSQTRKRYDGRGGLAVPFEGITPFSPSMTRAGVARRVAAVFDHWRLRCGVRRGHRAIPPRANRSSAH